MMFLYQVTSISSSFSIIVWTDIHTDTRTLVFGNFNILLCQHGNQLHRQQYFAPTTLLATRTTLENNIALFSILFWFWAATLCTLLHLGVAYVQKLQVLYWYTLASINMSR